MNPSTVSRQSSPCPGTPILPTTPDSSIPAVSSPDNGPCFKSVRFAAYIDQRPELIHIRTRRKSPNQNGVRERAFGSLKYEHLYRQYRRLFNEIRPHEALAMRRPLDVHLEATADHERILKSTEPETLPLS